MYINLVFIETKTNNLTLKRAGNLKENLLFKPFAT